jgi:hypothetical protein
MMAATDDRTTNCTKPTNGSVPFVRFVEFVVRRGGEA